MSTRLSSRLPKPPSNENLPLQPTTRSLKVVKLGASKIPPSAAAPSTRSASTRPLAASTRHQSRSPALPALVDSREVEISIQLPTSPVGPAIEGEHGSGLDDEDQGNGQLPSPPTSSVPQPEAESQASRRVSKRLPSQAGKTKQTSLPLVPVTSSTRRSRSPSAVTSTTLKAPTNRRTASRSPSVQPPAIPVGPSHAPHVLAARRRSSISPLPPAPSTAATQHDSLQPGTHAGSTSRLRASPSPFSTKPTLATSNSSSSRRRSKTRPRPSETLPEPLLVLSDEDEGGNASPDELLLLPSELGRGKGEGKAGVVRKLARSGTIEPSGEEARGNLVRRRSVSFVDDAPLEAEGHGVPFDDDVFELPEETAEDLGGFEHPAYNDYIEPRDSPEPTLQDHVGRVDQDEHVGSGSDGGRGDPADSAGGEASRSRDGAETGHESVGDPQEEVEESREGHAGSDEEDKKDFLPFDEPASDFSDHDDADEPFANQPAYDTSHRSPSVAGRDETPPPHDKDGVPQIQFEPLSPNTTGEFDDVHPIRFASTPPPEVQPEQRRETTPARPHDTQIPLDVPSPFLRRAPSASDLDTAPRPDLSQTSLLSPSFIQRTLARARNVTPSVVSPSLAPRVIESPGSVRRPQLEFVALPSPRNRPRFSRSPSLLASTLHAQARQPSPLSFGDSQGQAQESPGWTRGPAFFRSSSFSPPPVKSSFDRKGKSRQTDFDGQDGEAPEEEESREYWKPGAMTATSPHVSERGLDEVDEHSKDESVDGVREGSEELRGEELEGQAEVAPPTPAKDLSLSPVFEDREDQAGEDSDASMRSPVSIRSGNRSSASPPRSPNGDILMSSPAASIRSLPFSTRSSLSPSAQDKKLPATPPVDSAEGGDARPEDQLMASPSPARGQTLRRSPSKLEELVGAGRDKLTGLLFGSPKRPLAATSTPIASTSARTLEDDLSPAPEPSTAEELVTQEVEQELDEDDQPFPFAPRSLGAESTFSHAQESFATSASSSTSRSRLSRARPRPSHPTLPVIEISSTDAKAAARAAAILKVYHKYVEQGIEGGIAKHEVSRIVRDTERESSLVDGQEHERSREEEEKEEEEEELQTLLLDMEEEVRETFGRARSVSVPAQAPAHRPGATTEADGEPDPADEDEEVRSVLLSSRVSSPSSSQRAHPSSSSVASSQRARSVSHDSVTGLSSIVGTRWSSQEWRRLEQSLVGVKRKSKVETKDVQADSVVEAFLKRWNVSDEECQGDWEWDKLVMRVEAIKARRAKDVRARRATLQVSAVPPNNRSRDDSPAEVRGDAGAESFAREDSPVTAVSVKQEEASDEEEVLDASRPSELYDSDSASDSETEARDDTFFASDRRSRRARRTSMPHTRLPTALSNPRLAHIYDDAPAPEKPRLPMKEFLERQKSAEPSRDVDERSEEGEAETIEATPEPQAEPSQPTSAVRGIFSYLGSLVKRSPAPSPSSSMLAPSSSLSPEPDTSAEMSQVRSRPPVVASRLPVSSTKPVPALPVDKSLPHLANRKILPLPPTQFGSNESTPVASTSKETLDVPSASRRRRRSSGEGRVWEAVTAIEEAESSREEEEARIIEMLQSGSAKRKASGGDLRRKVQGGDKGKGKMTETVDVDLERSIVHSGTRALDRRPSGELRQTLR
ncbi:hypothetical protein JCM10212_005770 [Sporobolomyces blumeae]